MRIPFLELEKLNRHYWPEFMPTAERVIKSGVYIQGDEVKSFEQEFASYCGAKHCIAVGNGLDALVVCLAALGIGKGDEVLVPGMTFVATWLAVSRLGATPVPVDVEDATSNIDPNLLERHLTPRTKAVLPVHLYGATADMQRINDFAKAHGIFVVEDAAQAHGHERFGRRAGNHGHAGCFSFYPSKNLGCLGDGGGVTTNSDEIAGRVRLLANYGSTEKYVHDAVGFNSRLDPIQASFLRLKLKYISEITHARRKIAAKYDDVLKREGGKFLNRLLVWDQDSVWHNYVVTASDRAQFIEFMEARGVGTALHYPIIPSQQPCYVEEFGSVELPISQSFSQKVVSLPIGEYLSDDESSYVAEQLSHYCSRH